MTLIVTFPPHEDESGFGYYRRLGAENALWGWREVAAHAGVARTRAALFSSPDHVAAELGLERAWSGLALLQEQSSRQWRGLRRAQGDAVCPQCLAEQVYLRGHWEHALVVACRHHHCLLVDRCDSCGEGLSPHRFRIEQCSCGRDLREMPSRPSTPAQHWLASLMATNGHSCGGVAPLVRRTDPMSVSLLVRTLCLFADPSAPPPRRNSVSPRTVAEGVELLAPLEKLLADWPNAFEAHVAERIAAGRPQARTLNNLLGQWYAHLKRACQEKALSPFLEAVIRVAERDFDGALGLDMAGEVVTKVTEHYRAAEAAAAIGVGRDQLIKAIKRGEVKHRTSRFGTRGLVYEVPREEIARIRALRAAWMSEAEAAEAAAVSPKVLKSMVAAEVITCDLRWRNDLYKGGPIARQSLQELLERLNADIKSKAASGEPLMSWAELTSRRLGDQRAIQNTMAAASTGELAAVRRGTRIGSVQFRRADVQTYFGTPVLEAGMSVQHLAKATGWKWESISHWMELGLLESDNIQLRGQSCRVVAPEHLLRFRQTYIPLADLARSLGTTSTALVTQLPGVRVVGAKPLPNGVTRGGLVRLEDLARLAVVGAGSGAAQASAQAPKDAHG